jgi:integrase
MRSQLTVNRRGRSKESFSVEEIAVIIQAFKTDKYKKVKSAFKFSIYSDFVEFLWLTGCRPEEAIALTTNDIITKKGRGYIKFDKAYTANELRNTTKTGESRLLPISPEMAQLIFRFSHKHPESLLFTGQASGYISLKTFTARYFRPVIQGLYKDGLIENGELTTYNLRHSRITYWIERSGLNESQIAALVGTSTAMLAKTYSDRDRLREGVDAMALV